MLNLSRLVPNRWARYALAGAVLAVAGTVVGRHLWAYSEYRAARAELARYKFDQAHRHVQNCLEVWSFRPSVWLLAGQTARRMDRYDVAEQCYGETLRRSGGVAQDDLQLEMVLLQAQLDPDPKVPYLRQLIEADHPQSVLILEALTRGYLRRNRYPHAGFVVHLWLQKRPDDLSAHFHQGVVREELGPRAEAVDHYKRVLELDPGHDDARLRLVKLLLELARPSEAQEVVQPLVDRGGNDPKVLLALAECRYAAGERTAAEAAARSALDADPGDPDALVLVARAQADAERFGEAEDLLRKAIRAKPSHYQAHSQLHRVLASTGRDREAGDLKESLDRMTRDINRLRDIYTRDLSASPEDPALHCEVGQIFLRAGEAREGLRWLQEALRLDPDNRPTHRELAAFYRRLGDKNRAEFHAQKAQGGGPNTVPGSGHSD